MNKIHVEDLSYSELDETRYDLAIYSCGYEDRCTLLPSKINTTLISNSILLCFDQHNDHEDKIKSQKYFSDNWPKSTKINLKHDEIESIIEALQDNLSCITKEKISILIDYTSMSRAWYSAIINYLVSFSNLDVVIDLTYASGVYHDTKLNVELGELKILPGCEGISLTKRKNAAIFMLGFDDSGPLRLYDLLNPNKCYAVMASPASYPKYEEQCLEYNKFFIQHYLNDESNLLKLPINSVSVCYEHMSQLLSPLNTDYNVAIIPFGPKPHILTSILCGLNFNNVSCMYSEYIREKTNKVVATGEIVISRVFSNKVK